jgi:hypothetical protein
MRSIGFSLNTLATKNTSHRKVAEERFNDIVPWISEIHHAAKVLENFCCELNTQWSSIGVQETNDKGIHFKATTIGIVSSGVSSSLISLALQNTGCRILGYDPATSKVLMSPYGVQFIKLEKLCEEADILVFDISVEEYLLIRETLLSIEIKNGAKIFDIGGIIETDNRDEFSGTGIVLKMPFSQCIKPGLNTSITSDEYHFD